MAALFLVAASYGQNPPASPKTPAASSTNAPPRKAVLYRPAPGAVSSARVTGGSRGTGDGVVRLDILAPDDTGLTVKEQPSVFWFQSKARPKAGFEISLIEKNKVKPLLQIKKEQADKAGIQRLNLADHGVKLEQGVEYKWVVALITDPNNRSTDLVASGFIKRVEPSRELKEKIAKASPAELPGVYAEAGIWHETLSSFSDLVESGSDADTWRAARADLLRQVGLAKVVDSELPAVKK